MFRHDIGKDIELRLLTEQDADEVYGLVDRNRSYLRRWLPWVDQTWAPSDTRAFIRSGLLQLAENNGCQFGIWYRNELAGAIGYHYWDWSVRKTEIGYWLAEAFQGSGIMTRACWALIEHAFTDLKLRRVEIRTAAGNTKSRAIPERLGFTCEGILRQVERLHEHFDDQVIYGILVNEWHPATNEV